MRACIESDNPLVIHLAAARLKDQGLHPRVLNEASYVTGYPGIMGLLAVVVPNAEIEAAMTCLSPAQTTPLPDDAEFIDEVPTGGPVLPMQFPTDIHRLLKMALVIWIAASALGWFYLYAALPVNVLLLF